MTALSETRERSGVAFWNDPKVRSIFVQAVLVCVLLFLCYEIVENTVANLRKLNKTFGFDFTSQTSGFDIIQSVIPYSSASTYGRALMVGFLNTIIVSVLSIIAATIIGFVMGVMRLSKNWLVAKIATIYVEVFRNVPLLLWIIVFYIAALQPLPSVKEAYSLFGSFFLSKKGFMMPAPIFGDGAWLGLAGLIIAILASWMISRWSRARQAATGQTFPVFFTSLALIIFLPLFGLTLVGFPLTWEYPELTGFNFTGGIALIPELIAMFMALSIYTGTYIAEAVRAGIQAVSHGQTEAAHALGLRHGKTLRLVVVPQAMRVIIPPLASTYLSLTKNSSLAVAIGYPDLVAVGGTVLNQTGKAIEIVGLWMVVYLSLSLLTSLLMNWFNSSMKLVER
jgi:general L-amino acid transport system permease protein